MTLIMFLQSSIILFTDDTSVFIPHKDLDYLSHTLNLEMNKLSIGQKKRQRISYLDQVKDARIVM